MAWPRAFAFGYKLLATDSVTTTAAPSFHERSLPEISGSFSVSKYPGKTHMVEARADCPSSVSIRCERSRRTAGDNGAVVVKAADSTPGNRRTSAESLRK